MNRCLPKGLNGIASIEGKVVRTAFYQGDSTDFLSKSCAYLGKILCPSLDLGRVW